MKKYLKPFTIILIALMVTSNGCKSKKANNKQVYDEQRIKETKEMTISQRNNSFAFDFLKAVGGHDHNLIFSPFSISSALAMTYAGAAGETEKQMGQTLYFLPDQDKFHLEYSKYLEMLKDISGDAIELNIANNLWGQKGFHFRKEFLHTLQTLYGANLSLVDFEGGDLEEIRKEINSWVEKTTKEKIKNLIAPRVLIPDTRLVLVNAIHFYGPWQVAFEKEQTRPRTFFNLDNTRATANFMYRPGEIKYMENETLQAIELHYQNEGYSMVVMLPKEGIDIVSFEKNLSENQYSEIISSLNSTKVEVFLPKFRVEYEAELKSLLGQMGMPLAFSNDANFTRMSKQDDLKIDRVIHKAIVDVAEKGTEAAAATAVIIVRKAATIDEPKIVFDANRPFLYLIKENNENSIIFMGRQVKF